MTRPFIATGASMIHVAFIAPLEGAPREVSAEAFLLRGGQLEKQPDAEPVAFSQRGCWELERDRFARLECPDRVLCLFEEDGQVGEKHGPFSGLAVDGETLKSGERVIATLRGSYWQSEKTQRAWPRVRVVAPPD
jgi:hypothetical protein